jgi:hypothetical protein
MVSGMDGVDTFLLSRSLCFHKGGNHTKFKVKVLGRKVNGKRMT